MHGPQYNGGVWIFGTYITLQFVEEGTQKTWRNPNSIHQILRKLYEQFLRTSRLYSSFACILSLDTVSDQAEDKALATQQLATQHEHETPRGSFRSLLFLGFRLDHRHLAHQARG